MIRLERRDGRPLRIGHRGAATLAPENTLRSFRAAVETGVDLVEFDVLALRSGELVIAHSNDLHEVSHGAATGIVRDLPLARLREVCPELPSARRRARVLRRRGARDRGAPRSEERDRRSRRGRGPRPVRSPRADDPDVVPPEGTPLDREHRARPSYRLLVPPRSPGHAQAASRRQRARAGGALGACVPSRRCSPEGFSRGRERPRSPSTTPSSAGRSCAEHTPTARRFSRGPSTSPAISRGSSMQALTPS